MSLKVDTENFVNTHGQRPRGEGAWRFALGRSVFGCWTDVVYTGSYAQAKRQALSEARDIGGVDIVVLVP